MTVAAILAGKGRDVVTASPDITLEALCRLLAERRIGAVLVLEDGGRIAGIASERDVVLALARGGASALRQPLSAVMTRGVTTCAPSDGVETAMERMTHGRFRHLPVLDDGRLVGLVSIGDVVKHRIAEVEREAEEIRSYIATA